MIKFRKLVKRLLLVSLGLLLLLVVTAYILLQYRIKYILKEVVASETNGEYALDFSDHSFSLFNAHIKLKNARLKCVKPVVGQASYDVVIPVFYVSIDSWKTLLLERKLVVDSLYAQNPEIKINEANRMFAGNKMSMQLNDAYQSLKQLTSQLEVQTLFVREAKLGLYPTDSSSKPFVIDHLNLSIHNFASRKKESRHFLLTDDIDVFIRDQDWVLADGDSLRFSKLHFSGKKQRFIIDTCELRTTNIEKGRTINISADRFLVTSTNLTAAYLQNKLVIDTLTCFNPVVHVTNEEAGHFGNPNIPGMMQRVFGTLHFNYISVVDGQLRLTQKQNGSAVSYASRKSNIRLYDLDLVTGNPPSLSLRDLKFELDTVRFYTPDSLYVLRVGNFSILNQDLVCNNASFMPVSPAGGNMELFLPQIILRKISLPDLWQKKLKAEQAEFNQPEIIVSQRKGAKRLIAAKTKKKTKVYDVLHDFSSVVDVKTMLISEGRLQVMPATKGGTLTTISGINALIALNQLFQSGSVVDIKRTFSKAGFRKIQVSSPKMNLVLEDVLIHGIVRENNVGKASVQLSNGVDIRAAGIFWHQMDWDLLYHKQKLDIDELHFHKLDVHYNPTATNSKKTSLGIPLFNIQRFVIDELNAQLNLLNGTKLKSKGKSLEADDFVNNENGLQWSDARAVLENASYEKEGATIAVENAVFNKQNGSYLENATISGNNSHFVLPFVKFSTTITNTHLSQLHLEYLIVNDPQIWINKTSVNDKPFQLPFNLISDEVRVNKAAVHYVPGDSSSFSCVANVAIDSLRMLKNEKEMIRYHSCDLAVEKADWENKRILATVPSFQFRLPAGALEQINGKLKFQSSVMLNWRDAAVYLKDSSQKRLYATGLSGELNHPSVQIGGREKWEWSSFVPNIKLTDGNFYYGDQKQTIAVRNIKSDIGKGEVELNEIDVIPAVSKEKFFEQSRVQKDYQVVHCGKMTISGADIPKLIRDTAIDINTVTMENVSLNTSRDKNVPFEHGIEKLMPTKLICTIRRPVNIRTIVVKNGEVTSNETAVVTQREGSVPFVKVNGEIRNITNRPRPGDSLMISVSAELLGHHIRSLRYRESYWDSLSGFHLITRVSPLDLTAFSKISNPLAALDIKRGHADTLYTRIAGNQYGAFGDMQFYYRRLKVRFLNPMDTTKKNLGLSFKNFVTNEIVLKSKNKKSAQVFYIRDTEKFIFNYWFKAIFSGVIASAGIRNDKKYVRQYNRLKEVYSLPDME